MANLVKRVSSETPNNSLLIRAARKTRQRRLGCELTSVKFKKLRELINKIAIYFAGKPL